MRRLECLLFQAALVGFPSVDVLSVALRLNRLNRLISLVADLANRHFLDSQPLVRQGITYT
jgi:hypothetical protein